MLDPTTSPTANRSGYDRRAHPTRSHQCTQSWSTITITADFDTDTTQLREQVVPAVSHAPGFVAGYWTRKERSGLSVLVFESKDAAQAMSESLASMIPPDAATVDRVEVREVVAHA